MKSWQSGPDSVLLESVKMTALMSFCFGVGLLASSIIGVGAQSQLAETVNYLNEPISTTSSSTIGDTTNTITQTSTTASTSNTATSPTPGTSDSSNLVTPSLTFTSAVPSVMTADLSVTLSAVSIFRPQLVVRGLNVNKKIILDPVSQQSPIFNFLVRLNHLPIGRYEMIAKGVLSTGAPIEVAGPRFEILAPVTVATSPTLDPHSSSTSTTTNTTTSTVYNPESGSISSTTINISDDNTTLDTTVENNEVKLPELDIVIPNQTIFKGFVPVQVRTSVSLPEAFIYLKSPNLTTPRFVGKARYYDSSTLLLMVDTNQLPNGEHRIYALAKLVDVNVESERRLFFIDNSTTTTAIISTTTNPVITGPVASTTIQPKVLAEPINPVVSPVSVPPKIVPREVDNNILIEREVKPVVLSDELKALIPTILKEYEPDINQRLKTFGKDLHVQGANISKLRKDAVDGLMTILLDDYRLRSISTAAQTRLRTEVESLVIRTEKFELLLKEAESSSVRLDDLIKTFKEATTPSEDKLVDTSSPREFGLVREDIFQIQSVSPILAVDIISSSTIIYTEIRGRAIPNSLVTIYIYSKPVMVTVRADADGTFVYVYEKDLDGGDHEVYVALTTTEGEVVAKSPAFQFIREAQAFNSPDSVNGDSLIPAKTGTPLTQNPYFIVISITLLVVSLVFFLLGFKASKKSDDFTVV